MLLKAGQGFGAYRLEELVSRGGMGEVWRATKLGDGGWSKEIALKVILPTIADQDRFTELFLAEARIAAQLDHPNIVPVFAYGREEGLVYFEQELIRGGDLRQLITGGPLPVMLALYVAAEVLKGLSYAHERRDASGRPLGLVHRDVKPHNVLVSTEGSVKLSDFGIAKAVLGQRGPTVSDLKGTAGYIAPETLEGQPTTQQSDLFAVGLVLWELLVGTKLFDGESEVVRMKRTLDCRLPALASVGVTAPPAVDALLRRLVAKAPAARIASAALALEALLAIPGARAVNSLDLRKFLAARHVESLERSATPAPVPALASGPTMAGEVELRAAPARSPRWRAAVGSLFGGTAIVGAVFAWTGWQDGTDDAPRATAVPSAQSVAATAVAMSATLPIARASAQPVTVVIAVEPTHARLYLAGRAQPGVSPYELRDVEPERRFVLRAELDGYFALTREVRAGDPGPVVLRLEPLPLIQTAPTGTLPSRILEREGHAVEVGGALSGELKVEP